MNSSFHSGYCIFSCSLAYWVFWGFVVGPGFEAYLLPFGDLFDWFFFGCSVSLEALLRPGELLLPAVSSSDLGSTHGLIIKLLYSSSRMSLSFYRSGMIRWGATPLYRLFFSIGSSANSAAMRSLSKSIDPLSVKTLPPLFSLVLSVPVLSSARVFAWVWLKLVLYATWGGCMLKLGSS